MSQLIIQNDTTGSGSGNTIGISGPPQYALAVIFTTPNAFNCYSVKIRGFRQGYCGDITVAIYATSSSHLTGGVLVSKTLASSSFGTSVGWVEFIFASPYALAASTQYAIFPTVVSKDGSNWISWENNDSADSTKCDDQYYASNWVAIPPSCRSFQVWSFQTNNTASFTTKVGGHTKYPAAYKNGIIVPDYTGNAKDGLHLTSKRSAAYKRNSYLRQLG